MAKEFSIADLMRHTGDVLDDAVKHPVTITKRNKPKFVLMSVERYEQMINRSPQRAYMIDELPDDLRASLIEALERDLAEMDTSDEEA